jgi:hypothetical protein
MNEPGLKPDAPGHNRPPLTYKDAGVDIDAGDDLVEHIKPLARSTNRDPVLTNKVSHSHSDGCSIRYTCCFYYSILCIF